MSRILKIITAGDGWYVAYELPSGAICRLPVACWALCETIEDDPPMRTVRPITVDGQGQGMELGDDDCPGAINMGRYIGIIAPGEIDVCDTVMLAEPEE